MLGGTLICQCYSSLINEQEIPQEQSARSITNRPSSHSITVSPESSSPGPAPPRSKSANDNKSLAASLKRKVCSTEKRIMDSSVRLERIRGTPTPKKSAAGSLSDGPSVPSSSSRDRSSDSAPARKKKNSIDSAEVPVKGGDASGLGEKKRHAETQKGLSCSDCGARFRLR
jgi:hypothetical protein